MEIEEMGIVAQPISQLINAQPKMVLRSNAKKGQQEQPAGKQQTPTRLMKLDALKQPQNQPQEQTYPHLTNQCINHETREWVMRKQLPRSTDNIGLQIQSTEFVERPHIQKLSTHPPPDIKFSEMPQMPHHFESVQYVTRQPLKYQCQAFLSHQTVEWVNRKPCPMEIEDRTAPHQTAPAKQPQQPQQPQTKSANQSTRITITERSKHLQPVQWVMRQSRPVV